MKAYADSSFIVALYLQQKNSRIAAEFMRGYGTALPFTPWHRLEVRNAVRLAVFRGLITSQQGKTQIEQMEDDLREETVIFHMPIDWITVLRHAEKLGAEHNTAIGCRSSDLFHVAAAVRSDADHFLTFDQRQIKMAMAAGLETKS